MPPLSEVHYSRDSCTAAIRDYYSFLAQMYLDEEQVLEPPEGGWPSITAQNLRGLGKTDEVIALLRHLPYISRPNDHDIAHGSARCIFADWQRIAISCIGAPDEETAHLKWTTEEDFDGNVPSHLVGLTEGGENDNPIFLLDTELGIIHWRECPYEWRYDQVREQFTDFPSDYAPENEEEWRCDAPAWAVADFFEILKERFRRMDFVPISSRLVLYAESRNQESLDVVPMVKNIYREHGWPDLEAYRKYDCLLAIRTAMEARYPDVGLDP